MIRPTIHEVTSLSTGSPCGPRYQWSPTKRWSFGPDRVSATKRLRRPSIWMITRSFSTMAGQALAERAMLNVASGGTAESEASEVAVKPTGVPSARAEVITATPEACRRNACLKAARSTGACGSPSRGGTVAGGCWGEVVAFILQLQSPGMTTLFPRGECSRIGWTAMIQTIDLRGTRPTPAELLAAVPRALTDVASASDI